MAKKDSEKPAKKEVVSQKRAYISQSKIPKLALSEAIRLAQSLNDDFAGKPTQPHQLAIAVDISPTSSNWPDLCGASIAYGLTTGGYNAQTISLADPGRRIVAPTIEGADVKAKVEASLIPEIPNKFFQQYNHSKFPQDKIARNVLAQMGVPPERLDNILEIIKRNGEFVGIIIQTKTGPFVAIDTPLPPSAAEPESPTDETLLQEKIPSKEVSTKKLSVFISHSKNKNIVQQIKTMLDLAGLESRIATEEETTAIPVPDKVLLTMRECTSAIICVTADENEKRDDDKYGINQNVLIEIGSAFVLYNKKVVLVWDNRIDVPSNLQGLYRCEFSGNELSWSEGMKLMKALTEFKT
jgi:hypothetical protein